MAIIVEAKEVEDDDIGEASLKLPVAYWIAARRRCRHHPENGPTRVGLGGRRQGVSGEFSSWDIKRPVTSAALASKT